MNVLVTGGCGFVGAALIRHVLATRPEVRVVNLDALTYAGSPARLADVEQAAGPAGRYRFVHGDVTDAALVAATLREHAVDHVVHAAAETHVDRSLQDPQSFARTNLLGTSVLLEAARAAAVPVQRFLYVSTDEVYGPAATGRFAESAPLIPTSPYAASKAGADLLALAYQRTFGLPVVVARPCNTYGPWQLPEKLIPLMVTRAAAGAALPVYGDGAHRREWLHVDDHAAALSVLLERGVPGRVYNVGSGDERANLEVVQRILGRLGKPESLIRFVADRPAHDRRYALDSTRLRTELGWAPRIAFDTGLDATVDWYVAHAAWCQSMETDATRGMFARIYGGRLDGRLPGSGGAA